MYKRVFVVVFCVVYVNCINIEGQLTVIKNDCYERLAIGEKLSPTQTYKRFDHNTVSKCEQECTKEKDKCRAYSFGIGTKGNATCLLSQQSVKETVDLKPIGTLHDSEFDLYIKKLDCQIVLEPPHDAPDSSHHHQQIPQPPHNEHYGNIPAQSSSNNLYLNSPSPSSEDYHQPNHGNDHGVIQTLVSIASGPNSVLHPVHDILVSGDSIGPSSSHMNDQGYYGHSGNNGGNMPPFRPTVLGAPYHDHKPQQHYQGDDTHSLNKPYWPEFYHPDQDRPDLRPPKYPEILPHDNYGGRFTIDRRKYESFQNHHSSFESESYGFGMEKPHNYYDHYNRPTPDYPHRYGSVIPHPDDYKKPEHEYLFLRPNKPPSGYDYPIPSKPGPDHFGLQTEYNQLPTSTRPRPPYSTSFRPSTTTKKTPSELTQYYGGIGYGGHTQHDNDKSIITQTVGYNGEQITSIITELPNACFRRTMPGTRTLRSLVRKLVICETAEQCQRECGDERKFTCEGFNYRLDPTGQGKGTCELLDLPLSRIDLNKEIIPDSIYDLYTRDRNCGQPPRDNYYPVGSYGSGGNSYGYGYGNRKKDWLRPYDRRPTDIARPLRPIDRWDDGYGSPPARLPPPRPRPPPLPSNSDYDNRRGDYSYHHSHESHSSHSHHYNEHKVNRYDFRRPGNPYRPDSGVHYLPTPPKRIPVIIQVDYDKYPGGGNELPPDPDPGTGWQYGHNYRYDNPRPNYYIPSRPPKLPPPPEDWGQYGGSYGTGTVALEYKGFGKTDSYDYWGFNKFQDERPISYKPEGAYLPLPPDSYHHHNGGHDLDNAILPPEPKRPSFSFLRDECSLRSASGFRLHKEVVRKILTVADIYQCEMLCVLEKAFPCASYAFRYTSPNAPIDNCYLSTRNYKELDYYTDLEPDREFDVYTMNNRQKCVDPNSFLGRDESDCFWRVRSGQRLEHSVVRDSLNVKSIVDCQIECLKSYRFVCRAYSFRYGSPVIGGAIDNCQLTDWPLHELDPKYHFVPEPGFEIYKRGSFGHGCEPNQFGNGGRKGVGSIDAGTKIDQLCYVGFGSGSKLLPQATVKRLDVPTELDCKKECSKARKSTTFSCMTLSFQTDGPKSGPNCLLSDILQRDLLPNVDFIHDPNTWLFSWDNSKPECVDSAYKPSHGDGNALIPADTRGIDYINPLDVWKVYSVSGWPCRRGFKCQENKQAGFWYCELEGGGKDSWDYCCSPDHHCGLSNGYSYSWCYVGPSKTQWRKCSDQYYPYGHETVDRFDGQTRPWESAGGLPPPPHNDGFRPDRPNAPVRPPSHQSSSNPEQYEQDFNDEFLNPPKPGGFGQPRRWPVAYLHKELPPNVTSSALNKQSRSSDDEDKSDSSSNISAIRSLINTLNDSEIQYNISKASSNQSQEALFMTIPLTVTNMDDLQEVQSSINKTDTELTPNVPTARFLSRADGKERPSAYRRGVVIRTNSTGNYKRN